ncbi:MAG: GyrI-like domain-containing protein [Oscillospiraceae bacterium]|jgi:predicted transcriptional regulator YdeE|nr:GyrI-like domain-containing protein [Oscillospiraceae bacterium]
MEIKKVFTETVPAGRLIGKRYTDEDKVGGSFGAKWGEFMQRGWFAALEQAGGKVEFDYVAIMRMNEGEFEYWIGMFFDKNANVPEGFESIDTEEFEAAVFWIYGNAENGEIYCQEDACLAEMNKRGWRKKQDGWEIERYNCPRFTGPDDAGNVILDYYIQIS